MSEVANKKLRALVPSYESCRKIPGGHFEDSALVWEGMSTPVGDMASLVLRDDEARASCCWIMPAPTLQEIMFAYFNLPGVDEVSCEMNLDTEFEIGSQGTAVRGLPAPESALDLYLLKVKTLEENNV